MTLDPLRHFAFQHLPRPLQEVSRPFFEVAHFLVNTLKQGPERNAALRKLVEAKDCAVRAAIDGGALAGLNRPSGLAAGDLADRLGLGMQRAVDPFTGHALPPGSPYSAAREPVTAQTQAGPANMREDCIDGRGIETADKVYPYHPEMFREMATGERDPIGTAEKIQHVDGFEYAIDAGGYVIGRAPMYRGATPGPSPDRIGRKPEMFGGVSGQFDGTGDYTDPSDPE